MTMCAACGMENRTARRFCAQCGTALEVECANCGAANEPGDRFCGECGTALSGTVAPAAQPLSERRLVSVLFADLVGFTMLSEHRDPEEVRDLLSGYFDRCRTLIERYGGTVQKFIGDAVMAVWGSPVAREDDAERAVRAALDLTHAITALGVELGQPDLCVRVGVLTGSAAVEVGAEAEGMVLGDTVNTASRLQSIAAPGTVLVDDVTRRASQAAIAYEDGGTHSVKGREQPVHAYTALRVVARVGGARRGAGLEAPLVGRDHEPQAIIGALEATMAGQGARLVSVIGEAGLGKSRLAWELEKHADGLRAGVLWHSGRSLSYGDGVAFWALAEMIRMRAGIADEEDAATAADKLHATVEQYVTDPDERRLIEPRLAALLGLERRAGADQVDLFSGWRLFLERLAEHAPVAMVFEDMQWADGALLDFIEYLLEWSAARPIFMLVLARPELAELRPRWGEGRPAASTVRLEPLRDTAMTELLAALIPGAPEELRARIAARAEGVPLYATEIVRMLVDRGSLEQRGERYVLRGPLVDVEIPETLHALIAARLDGLPTRERRLLQDAAVLGLRFSEAGLVGLSDLSQTEVRAGLAALVERQFVLLDADQRSPERGQYAFGQALVRRVSYETLGRRERKLRHLRTAEHLLSAWGPEADEVADIRAAHLLDAVRAEPEASDAPAITARARETLIAAGERASRLGAAGGAADLFAQAAALTDAQRDRADLLDRAMRATLRAGDAAAASEYGESAIAIWNECGEPRRAALCSARLSRLLATSSGRFSETLPRLRQAYDILATGERDADLAEIAMILAGHASESGDYDVAWSYVEEGLKLGEELRLPEVISNGLNVKFIILYSRGRTEEAQAMIEHSLRLAREHELPVREIRARNNVAYLLMQRARNREALVHLEEAQALARRLGSRADEWIVEGVTTVVLFRLGRWEEAMPIAERMTGEDVGDRFSAVEAAAGRCLILVARGDTDGAAADVALLEREQIEHAEFAATGAAMRAALLLHTGEAAAALEVARAAFDGGTLAIIDQWLQEVRVQALEAMLALDDLAGAAELLQDVRETVARADLPYLAAQADRFAARIAARRADTDAAAQHFRRAAAAFREIEDPFALAVVLLEHCEALPGTDDADGLREEARTTFERLGAVPWLSRAQGLERTATPV